jgi:uncharacterized protein (TIGR02996 family)
MPSQRESLIAAIRATPEDDDVRRVCADWFEDQGDEASVARGQFIRLQLQRAALPLSDPQHSELQARELRLLKRWARVWCPQHFFRKVAFRRGFVERVHLHLKHFLYHRRQMLALEPVREVRVTGWRGTRGDRPDLVRRVAGCEEWNQIETLEIHHQGPHKDPGGDLLTLLESPHLSGLRGLRCPQLSLTAEDRRRFERLPLLARLKEFRFSGLATWPRGGGDWFEDDDGSIPVWTGLTALLLGRVPAGAVQRLLAMPFWPRLTSLVTALRYGRGAEAVHLDERLPAGLQELSLWAYQMTEDAGTVLVDRLRTMPLRRLTLGGMRFRPADLARILNDPARSVLENLDLDLHTTEEHARVLTEVRGLRSLRTLSLGSDRSALLASGNFSTVTNLDLTHRDASGPDEVHALAATPGWDNLRVLALSPRGVSTEELVALVESPRMQRLAVLTLHDLSGRKGPGVELTVELARALTRLPHLAYLSLRVRQCDPQARRILEECPSLAWPIIESHDERDIAAYRARRSPESMPPVDLK